MKESFHGRSFGALSVTGHDPYRAPFEPLVPGVSFAEYNDLDSVKALVTDKTCAIILEPLQGEGGINLATEEFMKGIRKLCDEEGILMIVTKCSVVWEEPVPCSHGSLMVSDLILCLWQKQSEAEFR